MYEKIRLVVICILINMCMCACKTVEVDSTGIGERNQYVCGQLDSTIKSLDRDLADCDRALQECTERSRGIEDLAERLKYLTTEYFRITKQIQDANNRALSELNVLEEDMYESSNNIEYTSADNSDSTLSRTN